MPIGISEEHEALRRSARDWLDDRCPSAVPRALLDDADEPLTDRWPELAALGWPGMHLPEEYGGAGGSLLDLAVVLEETGRAMLPGPLLMCAITGAVVASCTDEALRKELLPQLAEGRSAGTVAWVGSVFPVTSREPLTLSGELVHVLSAAHAALFVVAADIDGEREWCVVDAAGPGVDVVPERSLDATRRLGALRLDGAPARRLPGVTDADVGRAVRLLVAAEAVGGAAWCLDTAVAYAKVREQFGRPIGQFQAIKHRCADLLITVEQARAAVWDAAQAVTAGDDAADLCSAVAAERAVEAWFTASKDLVQILGGIGFTWEHDAHLQLKRGLAMRQLLDPPSLRAEIATLALRGVRRHLDLALPAEAETYRADVQKFVASVADLDEADRRVPLAEGGWLAPHWPAPWGRGADAVEQLVIDEEFRRARIWRPHLQISAWVVPTLLEHGTEEQQQRFIPASMRGELTWCQLFSEPGAGSDLAALSTRAVRTEGGWLVTGQKVWTSLAHTADFGILLARTNLDAPKHEGISYFLLDMKAAGVDIRPLREITGAALFNEVFLTDVFVPDDCLVGAVDGGWRLARTTLANERVAMASGSTFGGGLEAVLKLVDSAGRAEDAATRDQLGALLAEAQALAVLGFRSTVRAVSGSDPGPESSVRKLLGVEHEQRVQELGLGLLGPAAATLEGDAAGWVSGFLSNRCLTIAGGTSEVQRNVIAERLLGLPRDP